MHVGTMFVTECMRNAWPLYIGDTFITYPQRTLFHIATSFLNCIRDGRGIRKGLIPIQQQQASIKQQEKQLEVRRANLKEQAAQEKQSKGHK
jgi:hypothetical protein